MKHPPLGEPIKNLQKMDVLHIYVVEKLFLETHAGEKA